MPRLVVIGAGISGLSIARRLSRYSNLEIIVVEKNPDVGWGASKANTSIIHPCHEEEPEEHPLRARLCREGHILWRRWLRELSIPHSWRGELMVASREEEIKTLYKYLRLAEANGIPDVRIVYGEEIWQLEPMVNRKALAALWAPTAGIMSPMAATIALAENAADNGVKFLFETRAEKIVVRDKKVVGVETTRGFIEADIVVNAAGVHADELSRTAGVDYFKVSPRRGQYILYSKDVDVRLKRIVHTAPTPKTKGVYAISTLKWNLMIGPTAEDLPMDRKEDTSTTRSGIKYILEQAERLLERLPPSSKIIRLFSGIRPEPSTGDYIIEFYEEPWGLINVAGIRSPGLTAAPGIAMYVENLIKKHVELVEKKNWSPYRKPIRGVKDMDDKELSEATRRNPGYGRIICMCEMISEAEIREAIRRMKKIGVKTITFDGVKFRTKAMFGECQGQFCRPIIARIISEETGIPMHMVSFKGGESRYGIGTVWGDEK